MTRMQKLWAVLMVVLLVGVAGCGVILSPTYSQLLDKTAALAGDNAARYDANQLTPAQVGTCLHAEANAWQSFRNARDGKR